MHFGDNFNANTNCSFWCSELIEIGEDTLFGFDITVRDSDGHRVSYEERKSDSKTKPIHIGKHVWCGSKSCILKGTQILDGSVIGFNSCVISAFQQDNILIGGYPARKIKENIMWEK